MNESTDDERDALRGVGAVMRDHEPYWNLGQCRCGAPLGDRIDWDWHLANQATPAALRRQGPITDASEIRIRQLLDRRWPAGPGECGACGVELASAIAWARHFVTVHESSDENRH